MDAESSQIQDELSINLQAVIDSWDYRFAASLKVLHGCYWRTCNRKDCKSIGSPGIRKEREESEKDEREKPLLFKRHKVVRFLISPKKKKVKIEVNKIMNPAFLRITRTPKEKTTKKKTNKKMKEM